MPPNNHQTPFNAGMSLKTAPEYKKGTPFIGVPLG